MKKIFKKLYSKEIKENGIIIYFLFFKINLQKFLLKFGCFVRLLDNILPKDKECIAFFSFPDFSDNPKVFADYLSKNHKEYKLCWLYYYPLLYNNKKHLISEKAYYRYSIKGIWHLIRSKYIVFSYAQSDFLSSRSKHIFINLWHGMPIKTLGFTEKQMDKVGLKHYGRLAPVSHLFVTSDIFKVIMSSCFLQNFAKIHITGQPRTDLAFSSKLPRAIKKEFNNYTKIICYAPTFKERLMWGKRDITVAFKNIFYLDDYAETDFICFLEKNNWLFIFKPHPLDEQFYKKYFQKHPIQTKNFKIVYDSTMKEHNIYFYELFNRIDLLICDFSSIALDYLITGKPVVYLDSLNDDYGKTRGFILEDNYEIFMPGEKVFSYKELKGKIKNALTVDSYKEKRLKQLPLIHKYRDSNACERVYKVMKGLK